MTQCHMIRWIAEDIVAAVDTASDTDEDENEAVDADDNDMVIV